MKALSALIVLFAAQPATAAQITSLVYGGSGCPAGSVNAVLAPDGSSLSILYSGFVANVGGAQAADAKDCTIEMKIAKPVVQALVLDSADFRGYVGLEAGASAQQRVDVQSGYGRYVLNQQFGFATWQGPLQQNYLVQAIRPVTIEGSGGSLVECASQLRKDTKLVFKTKVRMQSQGGRQGLFTVDSVDGRVQQLYRFRVENCLARIPDFFPRR